LARLAGEPVRRGRASRGLGFVPQLTGLDHDLPLRAEDAVLLGLAAGSRHVPWYSRAERLRARALLDRLGRGGMARRPVGQLSGGQQQRLLLARAMVAGPALVILDEPTSGVDLRTLQEVLGLLDELRDQGTTIVLMTHDLNWVAAGLPGWSASTDGSSPTGHRATCSRPRCWNRPTAPGSGSCATATASS